MKSGKTFGVPRRTPETEITQPYMNMALAIQDITEEVVLRLANTAKNLTGSDHLVMAGGVALNCVANGKVLRNGLFKDLWIQPGAGDAGGALGAALAVWHIWKGHGRKLNSGYDSMEGAYLGPDFCEGEIQRTAKSYHGSFAHFENFDDLCKEVVERLVKGRVVGWFQGEWNLVQEPLEIGVSWAIPVIRICRKN